jgi:hypothetical protein
MTGGLGADRAGVRYGAAAGASGGGMVAASSAASFHDGARLIDDIASFLLLEDNASDLCLEAGC